MALRHFCISLATPGIGLPVLSLLRRGISCGDNTFITSAGWKKATSWLSVV